MANIAFQNVRKNELNAALGQSTFNEQDGTRIVGYPVKDEDGELILMKLRAEDKDGLGREIGLATLEHSSFGHSYRVELSLGWHRVSVADFARLLAIHG